MSQIESAWSHRVHSWIHSVIDYYIYISRAKLLIDHLCKQTKGALQKLLMRAIYRRTLKVYTINRLV